MFGWKSDFSYELQSLPGGDVPVSSFFDFSENPRFDESTTGNHNAIDAATFYLGPVILGGEGIAAAENGDSWHFEVSAVTKWHTINGLECYKQSSSASRARTAWTHSLIYSQSASFAYRCCLVRPCNWIRERRIVYLVLVMSVGM